MAFGDNFNDIDMIRYAGLGLLSKTGKVIKHQHVLLQKDFIRNVF